jgi:hypothetical protein
MSTSSRLGSMLSMATTSTFACAAPSTGGEFDEVAAAQSAPTPANEGSPEH